MPEQYVNDVVTTLNGDIDGSTTTVVVASATGFPSAGNFRIRVDDEIMIVTARTGTSLTVTRGAESTSGASHLSGGDVSIIHTAGAIDAIRGDQCTSNTFANRPAVSKNGNIFLATNSPVALSRENGSAWTVFGPLFKFTAPVDGDFTWTSQGSATVTTTFGGIILDYGTDGLGIDVHLRKKNAPATPWTLTAAFLSRGTSLTNSCCGILVRQSSDGKLATWGTFQDSNTRFVGFNLNSPTSHSATHTDTTRQCRSPVVWLRIADNGTNRLYQFSINGLTWETITSVTRTSFLTADEIGFYVNRGGSEMHLLHWEEG